ncbi:MAG: DUF1385 domain-containing protein [bacterium]
MNENHKTQVGGQAVIEGVMMRSPEYVSVAVRKPDDKILVKRESYISWTKRNKLLGLPFIRGGVVLIESMVLGIKALNFSGDIAMQEESGPKHSKNNKLMLALTVIIALILGIGLFFYLPLILTELTGVVNNTLFNLIDGVIRLIFLLTYIFLISRWKEIKRIFEYHGAEHLSIFIYENKKPMKFSSAEEYTTHHPRCGTSFLFMVMIVAVLVFILLGKPETITDRIIRLLFVPVIGGISYEIIRLSGKKFGTKLAKIITAPGLWLQNLTTERPDEKQLEVAFTALKSSLDMELDPGVEVIE